MIYPSIDEMLEKVDSKYTLVTIASKRARQLKENGDLLITRPISYKHVGTSLEELNAGKITYQRIK